MSDFNGRSIFNSGNVGNPTAASTGAVSGPGSSTNNDIALFNGVTGQIIKDSGVQISTDGTFAANSDALIPTQKATKTYVDGLVVGLWDDRGNYDASGNTFPASGGSGSAGAILKGDIWTISVAGTLGGVPIATRQTVRAGIDTPGQTAANWYIGLANTDIDDSITDGVTGRAPSQNAVFDALALKASLTGVETLTNKTIQQTINAQTGTTYTFVAADFRGRVTANNASAQTYTLPQQSTLTTAAGVGLWLENIGTGTITLVKEGAETLTGNTTLAAGATVFISRDTTTNWSVFAGTAVVPMPALGAPLVSITTSQTKLIWYAQAPCTFLGLFHQAFSVSVAGSYKLQLNGVDIAGLTAIVPATGGGTASASSPVALVAGDKITAVANGTLVLVADMLMSPQYTQTF